MGKLNVELIKKLREETGAPVMRVKKVLEELKGNEKEAIKILTQEGFEKAEKRSERSTSQGLIKTYVHHSGKIAGVAEVLCETDFVARNELFDKLASDLAMQVVANNPKDASELEKMDYIRDSSKTVADIVKDVIAKTGENIRVGRIYRLELGN